MKLGIVNGWGSVTALAACAALAAGPAGAQSSSGAQGLHDNSFVANIGAFIFQSDVRAALNGQSTNNPEVDFDEDLGRANDSKRGRLDLTWRINPNHHLRFLYFDNSVSRSKVLTRNIEWGDYTFQTNTALESQTDLTVYALAYEYAFLRTPSYELSASLGVHYMDISLRLSGTATLTGSGGSVSAARTESSDLPAPLPMIGLRGGWVISPQWYLDAQAQFFEIDIDGYDGRWTDARLGVTWMFSRNFGVGLGYNMFATRVDVNRDNYKGRLKFGYSGALAYLTGTF